LLRKSDQSLSLGLVEKRLCKDNPDGEFTTKIAATWLPMASQFPEARCHAPNAEFLSVGACRHFLSSMRSSHSGILQAFVEPHGVSNFLVRTVQFREQTSLCVRTNRSLLAQGKGNPFDRAATFEGWPGLSSTSSRYRSHKHPHMEELIHAAGETLNWRIEQERVRQMLFLGPTQHVALHFKVTKDHLLFFIYASVVSEKEVILQTRPQLLMGDPCMTEPLPGAALLPGGTDVKAIPYKGPSPRRRDVSGVEVKSDDEAEEGIRSTLTERLQALQGGDRSGSLPPLRSARSVTSQHSDEERGVPQRRRYRTASEQRRAEQEINISAYIPRMGYARPEMPDAPYLVHGPNGPGRNLEHPDERLNLNSLKRPLISMNAQSMGSDGPGSARSLVHTSRSEPGPRTGLMDTYRSPASARPPPAPEQGSPPQASDSVLSAAARAQAGWKPPPC